MINEENFRPICRNEKSKIEMWIFHNIVEICVGNSEYDYTTGEEAEENVGVKARATASVQLNDNADDESMHLENGICGIK